MAAVSTSASHLQINTLEASDEDPYSPTTRDTATPEDDDKTEDRPTLSSSFSIQNVLKKEREDHSHENVFSTDKLLKNTPELDPYEREDSPRMDIEDRMSNTDSYRAEVSVDDEASCCSDDTVLSVGNEAQNFNSSAESTSKSTPNSPGTPPPHNLTSFKHIQTHLNAISQLSQSINLNQPVLLRPNPITPNLMFLNQQHMLFQNPLLSPEAKSILPNRIPLHQQTINFGLQQKQQRIIDDRRIDDRRFSLTPKSDEERRENLKFSIDNILKADFGRRITDPLTKRRSLKRPQAVKPKEAVPTPRPVDNSRVSEKSPEKAAAIDLSKNDDGSGNSTSGSTTSDGPMVWPAWVYCTRYSDRPSSGPRTRRPKKPPGEAPTNDEKRPRTAFSGPQLARLKHEFTENRYLTERRRQALAAELGLAEAQIKIWFQNKRAKIKKASGQRNPLALQLMAQGLYNHSTVPLSKEEEELEMKAREREMQREEQLG